MTDRLEKFLQRLERRKRKQLLEKINKLKNGDLEGLDCKRLVNTNGLFRLRVGKIRLIFRKKGDVVEIIDVDFRGGIY